LQRKERRNGRETHEDDAEGRKRKRSAPERGREVRREENIRSDEEDLRFPPTPLLRRIIHRSIQKVPLTRDHAVDQKVVDDAPECRSVDLADEEVSRGDFHVEAEFEV
jgi:hypothetical protein